MLRLHDSSVGRVVDVLPRDPGRIAMYICGPTVYELPHIGHGRAVLTWDVLRRWLTFRGLDVRHVANVTDVDDHIIDRASAEGRTEPEVAAEYEAAWWAAMDGLGALRPHVVPHATEYIQKMVVTVGALLESGHAYRTDDGVYLDTSTVPDYGLLAGQPLETLRAGARVEVNGQKRAPIDFALWKAAKPGEPSWDAPFGAGRPGWHTECVVMSLELLGEGFDLHGGGQDLRFPHHENERAQAVALSRSFARHWMHHGFVEIGGEKMSRSLRNFTTLTDLLARSDPRAYRLLVLRAHYRGPFEVTEATIADAERGLARLDALARRFGLPAIDVTTPLVRGEQPGLERHAADVVSFGEAMDDDLDTPRATALLFELTTRANTQADAGDDDAARATAGVVGVLAASVGLSLQGGSAPLGEWAEAVAADRDAARSRGDFAAADELRDQLVEAGYLVEDTPAGTRVVPR